MGMLRKKFWGPTGEPPVPTYSKMKCVMALTKLGVWPQVKAWIESQGLYDLYLAAQDFTADNEYFKQGLAALKEQLGLDDDQVAAVLDAAILPVGG